MRKFKCLFLMFILFISIVSNSLIVFADRSEVDSMVHLGNKSGEGAIIMSVCNKANATSGVSSSILVYTGADGILSFSNKLYKELSTDEKREFIETALLATRECSLSVTTKNKMYNFIADQDSTISSAVKYLSSDASADLATARMWFRPFSSGFGKVMGFFCLLIFLFLGSSVVFDISYLVLPGFQMLLERGSDKKPIFVSREAHEALKEVESTQEGKNIMSVYLKKRLGLIILISICLGYLISGQIYDLIVFIVEAFTF